MSERYVDITLFNPAKEFGTLYRYAQLPDTQPIRVSVPVVPGFQNAVILAASLKFAVRLNVGQPDPLVMPMLLQVLNLYLHDRSLRQPIEFFHSSFSAFYNDAAVTLWNIYGRRKESAGLEPECEKCEFVQHCAGFFKSPMKNYRCDGVKTLLRRIATAATELKRTQSGIAQGKQSVSFIGSLDSEPKNSRSRLAYPGRSA